MLAACRGLVVYREKEGVFAFSHPTVQDFLKRSLDTSAINRDISLVCLRYLRIVRKGFGNDFSWYAYDHRYKHIENENDGKRFRISGGDISQRLTSRKPAFYALNGSSGSWSTTSTVLETTSQLR